MAVADIIKTLEVDNSRLAKEAIIKSAATLATIGDFEARTFLKCAQLAYDPYSKWGVKQVPEVSGQTETVEDAWDFFFPLLDDLKHRSLTGNAARVAINKVSELFSDDDWNLVCRRVLIKDLRCGITATTLNKFVPKEFQVPGFGCQLAVDGKDSISDLTGRYRLERKLDGVRMLAIVEHGVVTISSRNGKELVNFPHVAEAIEQLSTELSSRFANGFVLDGEIMSHSFQALMRQAQRKSDVVTHDTIYNIFDIVDLDAFKSNLWNVTQEQRSELLESHRAIIETHDCLRISGGITVDLGTEHGHNTLHDYFAQAITDGYEGVMIKDINGFYETKRTKAWLKKKPTLTLDLTIVDVEQGTGRNEGRLGALVCSGLDDEGNRIKVNVGSGFSDEQRDDIWQNKSTMIGQVAEVMADAVTQNQDGTYSLRFPRFVRFRGFEAGEKM